MYVLVPKLLSIKSQEVSTWKDIRQIGTLQISFRIVIYDKDRRERKLLLSKRYQLQYSLVLFRPSVMWWSTDLFEMRANMCWLFLHELDSQSKYFQFIPSFMYKLFKAKHDTPSFRHLDSLETNFAKWCAYKGKISQNQ